MFLVATPAESEVSVPVELMISRVESVHISIRWRSWRARSLIRLSDTNIDVAATAMAAMIISSLPKDYIT